jgi:hypothetical protein
LDKETIIAIKTQQHVEKNCPTTLGESKWAGKSFPWVEGKESKLHSLARLDGWHICVTEIKALGHNIVIGLGGQVDGGL